MLVHCLIVFAVAFVEMVMGGQHELRLLGMMKTQLKGFNLYERPSERDNETLKVELKLTLQQIIDVDEKNQIIYTNMWINMKWSDYKLRWTPADYGNITRITVPPDVIWRPDILMYNSAADSFDASYNSRVQVNFDGTLEQIPPGMFKSTCHINIRWFPFDDQECILKFGSWTFDGTKIDLRFMDGVPEGSTDGFQPNGEWDLMGFPAKRNVITYECCPQNPYVDLTYSIKLRRRKLYYLVNIVGPCVLFAFLGLFTFILPPDAGEKISFSVTILLSLTVFMMIVSETLPPTSEAIPLIAVYFMGIMVMTAISVVATMTALSYHHRTSETHSMSRFMKIGIGEWLAWILRMKRPGHDPPVKKKKSWNHQKNKSDFKMLNVNVSQSLLANIKEQDGDNFYSSFAASSPNLPILDVPSGQTLKLDQHPLSLHHANVAASNHHSLGGKDSDSSSTNLARFELRAILKELRYLTNKMKDDDENQTICSDWKWCAMVIDRLFVWIIGVMNVTVAASVLLAAPNLFS